MGQSTVKSTVPASRLHDVQKARRWGEDKEKKKESVHTRRRQKRHEPIGDDGQR